MTTPIARVTSIVIDTTDVATVVEFWTTLLGIGVRTDYGDFVWLDRMGEGGPMLAVQKVPETKEVKNRLHMDLAVDDRIAFARHVEELGGTKLDEHTMAGFTWNVMADSAGNEFCISEPDQPSEAG